MIDRITNILIILAAITFVVGMGIGYGFFVQVFSAGTFWRFSIGCLSFAVALTLLQIKEKK
ncbi:MAG: hypothetical protein ISS43_01645 [Candidatus Omnitrophica bacterium]|nr:hypothetical protein [Candidatus Omnitrophota bacterium]